MNFLPVIARELRLRSRQRTTYWIRCALAGMAAMVAVQEMVVSANASNPNVVGETTFRVVAWLGFFLACGCALVTADTLSRERREGTLGLLLLTKLKGYDVVLGKLCASGLTASYALVGFLPALGLVILAGGVSRFQFGRTSLALLDALFLFLAIGIWVSSRSQNRSKAMRAALAVVLGVCVGPRIIMYAFGGEWVSWLSPLTTFYLSWDVLYAAHPASYWISLAAIQLEGWGLLAWTGFHLLRNCQAKEWTPKAPSIEWAPLVPKEAEALAAGKKAMLDQDPVCWSVSRMKIQGALWIGTILLLLGGTGFTWSTLMAKGSRGVTSMGLWDGLHLIVSLASAALLASAAGRFLFDARRNGELELLLTTPVGARDIIGGNWRALCRPLRGVWLLVAFLILIEIFSGPGARSGLFLFQTLMAPVVRVLDILALCWVGMYFGLKSKKVFSIIGWTVGLVVALPWVLSFVFIIFLSLGFRRSSGFGFQPPLLLVFWFFGWPLLNLLKNVLFINWASAHLRADLRTQAAAMRSADWLQ
jgi:hypothetical protein